MKKSFLLVALLATACLFSACKKDGVFNPKQKISALYTSAAASYSYTDEDGNTQTESYSTPRLLSEKWNWDGKTLSSIDYYDIEGDEDGNYTSNKSYSVMFDYDGKQLVKASYNDKSYCDFIYDGKKIDKINVYSDNTLDMDFSFTYDGKKVSTIVVTEHSSYDFKKSAHIYKLRNFIWSTILPDANVEKVIQSIDKLSERTNAKGTTTTTVELTWNGDNVASMTMKSNYDMASVSYSYDDKNNPINGFLAIPLISEMSESEPFSFLNENNVTKIILSAFGEAESYEYSYKYDGNWPVSRSVVSLYNDDSYSSSLTLTQYYEYL